MDEEKHGWRKEAALTGLQEKGDDDDWIYYLQIQEPQNHLDKQLEFCTDS